MRVHWTENAVEHLVNIYEYIALNSPTYAKRMVDKITRRSEQIKGVEKIGVLLNKNTCLNRKKPL